MWSEKIGLWNRGPNFSFIEEINGDKPPAYDCVMLKVEKREEN